jgi:transposase
MQVTTFSIDLAKRKFQVHGYSAHGEKIVVKTLTRDKFLAFFRDRPERSRVVMEACATSHHWARQLRSLGFRPELLPAQHVAALVIGQKNDANDADAIYEAAHRPKIRPVPVKSESQQDLLAIHRVRDRLVKTRTALINQVRGLLAERGVVFDKRTATLKRALPRWLEEAQDPLKTLIESLLEEWRLLEQRIANLETALKAHYRATPACQRIGAVEGIGVLTATATVASVGDARAFHSGRQFAAWIGLTPRERSSGERRHLGGITKRGDGYLRKLLIHGARSAVRAALRKEDTRSRWIKALITRRGMNKAVVALANKNARILYALLSRGEDYRVPASA